MDIDWIDFGIKIFLGALSIAIYALWKVREYLNKTFDPTVFWKDNKAYWLWSFAMLLALLLVITIEPGAGEAIKSAFGIDVSDSRTSFITLGFVLAGMANGVTDITSKNPIGTRKKE